MLLTFMLSLSRYSAVDSFSFGGRVETDSCFGGLPPPPPPSMAYGGPPVMNCMPGMAAPPSAAFSSAPSSVSYCCFFTNKNVTARYLVTD